jgi:2-aminoadipate transaminase
MNYASLFASRTKSMGVNAIREVLKVVAQPGMVSLAGGIPAPESFPLDLMHQLTEIVLHKYGPSALQYDTSEGFGPLRQVLADHLAEKGVRATADEVLVASGSQGVLDALGMVLISKGDRVAVEAPTYLGALQAFTPYEPVYVKLETDENGVLPESLEKVLKHESVKFIYLVPTFQNPTGRTIPLERRKAIAALIRKYHALLVEDDPYGALRYKGEPVAPIKTLAPDHVVYVSTLSKVFAPGLRIGFCVAPEPLRRWLLVAKQGVDLHTSTFNQALAAEYIGGGYLENHLPHIIGLYRPRMEAMLKALAACFPTDFTWSKPEGGMFIWVEGRPDMDMEKFYWKAVERKVAFVPGKYFYVHPGEGLETMRLNFTMADENMIKGAVAKLAELFRPSAKG